MVDHSNERRDVAASPSERRRPFPLVFAAIVLLIAGFLWLISSGKGGQVADSPDGRYRCSIMTELDPEPGDPYEIVLADSSGNVLRKVELKLSAKEPTRPLRGGDRVLRWSEDSRYVEVLDEGKPVMRLHVPE